MPDPIRLYSNLNTHSGPWSIFVATISSTARRSGVQAGLACAGAPATGSLFFEFSARIAKEAPDGQITPTNNGSRRSRSKALMGVELQWTLALILSFGKEERCQFKSRGTNSSEDRSHGNYDPDWCLPGGRGLMESRIEAGWLLPRFKERTQTTNYNTHTHTHTVHFVHVNLSLIICHFSHQSLVPLSWSLRQIDHFLPKLHIPAHQTTW